MTKNKLRVLIIEDDKFISKAMKYKFEREKFQVKTSTNVEEGFKILDEWTPDTIILDILLQQKDGFAFLRETRIHPKWSKIPVIVASNLPEDPDIQPGENTGYTEYIVKSDLDLDDVVKRVKKLSHAI